MVVLLFLVFFMFFLSRGYFSMDGDDIFVWPDGSWLYREDYSELTDRWRGNDFEIFYVGTIEYNDFLQLWPDDEEGGPDDEYWLDDD
ncbi:Uncharacterised protein [Salmonella enterica subsp. diarizonae]|nr:Uncharacterised protein [Salmonella enterica subsp. diarizonae]